PSRLPSFVSAVPLTSSLSSLSLHAALPICAAWPLGRGWLRAGHSRMDGAALYAFRRACLGHGDGQDRRQAGFPCRRAAGAGKRQDRKSTCLNSSHVKIEYSVFWLKKKTE